MKFFIPATDNPEKAEELYQAIKKFAAQSMGWVISDRRIRSITFRDKERRARKKSLVHATVGEREPCEGREPVIAIFESNSYLVCTPSRGVLRGIPIMVGKHEVIASEDFA
ncbi:MAG TPA: hypothetical protein VJN21_02460 [Candidatus Acidoferrales bacterium]|nr:hypothetical protein [Candidatus Acidoferrales bacterium]